MARTSPSSIGDLGYSSSSAGSLNSFRVETDSPIMIHLSLHPNDQKDNSSGGWGPRVNPLVKCVLGCQLEQ